MLLHEVEAIHLLVHQKVSVADPRHAHRTADAAVSGDRLPAAGIGLLVALDAIPDTFASALNSTGFLAAVAIVAPSTISEHVPQYAEQ